MKTRAGNRWLATTGILIVVAACSGAAGQPSSTPTAAPTSAPASTPTASSPTLGPTFRAGVTPVEAGPQAGRVLGGGSYPGYTVVVPAGWSSDRGYFVLKYPATDAPGPVLGVSVWDVGPVPEDPCHWQGQQLEIGTTVADLVKALVRQKLRNATKPTDVTLAGYTGQYLEWSVPADMKASARAEFDACDVTSDGHHDFQSWVGNGFGTRYEQFPGQVDRLWVLDVKGQRLVVDATYTPDTTQTDRGQLKQIVESLRFVAP